MRPMRQRTDMTLSVPRMDENGHTEIKVYRIWRDNAGKLWLNMHEQFVALDDVIKMFGEVRING